MREIIEKEDGNLEVVCNEGGVIMFVKETKTHQGDQPGSDITTVSGYGIVTDTVKDIGFTHLEGSYKGYIVDFQYIDENPEGKFPSAKLGTLKVYDSDGNLVDGELITSPRSFRRLVVNGQVVSDFDEIAMSAPQTVKEIVGKNISDISDINISRLSAADSVTVGDGAGCDSALQYIPEKEISSGMHR